MKITYKNIMRVTAIVMAGLNICGMQAQNNDTINFSLRYNPGLDRTFNNGFKMQITRMTWKNSAGQQCAPDDINPTDTTNNPLIFPASNVLSFEKMNVQNKPCYLDKVYFKILSEGSTSAFSITNSRNIGVGLVGCEGGCEFNYGMKLGQIHGLPKEIMDQTPCFDLIARGKITNASGTVIGRITSFTSDINKVINSKYPCPIYP